MENDLTNIFLTYANNLLSDNPDNYTKTTKEIQNQQFLKYLIDPKQLAVISEHPYHPDCFRFGWTRNVNHCKSNCYKYKLVKNNKLDLDCFECAQLFFIHILDELASGKELTKIRGYKEFMDTEAVKILFSRYKTAMQHVKHIKTEPEPLWGEATQIHDALKIMSGSNNDTFENKYFPNTFFQTIIAVSLLSFIDSKDRHRLRKCPHCKKFFIAKDTKRKICYSLQCVREYHRKDMKKRRDEDPVKYC